MKANLFIIGVHKGGTTSLYTYLKDHPDVFAPLTKELHFFTPARYGNELKPYEDYNNHFRDADDQKYRLDTSPSYLYGGAKIANLIKNYNPEAKIVLIIRQPAKRLRSFFHHLRSKQLIDSQTTFDDFTSASFKEYELEQNDEYLNRGFREGCYAEFIPDWVTSFGSNFEIVFFEDLVSETKSTMKHICKFLDVDDSFYDKYDFLVENATKYAKNSALHRIALFINNRFEHFFRKNLYLKRKLRKIYFFFNQDNKPKNEDLHKLNSWYKNHNQKLYDYLERRGINIPEDWDS